MEGVLSEGGLSEGLCLCPQGVLSYLREDSYSGHPTDNWTRRSLTHEKSLTNTARGVARHKCKWKH